MSLKKNFLDSVDVSSLPFSEQEQESEVSNEATPDNQEQLKEVKEVEPPSDEPEKENLPPAVEEKEEEVKEVVEEVKAEEEEKEEVVQEIDYKSFIEQHRDTIKEYLVDYKSMDKVEVLKLKLEKDGFDKEEIQDYLENKYGIGVEKIKINPEEMSEDDIKEAKKFNRELADAKRNFKIDAEEAANYFEGLKGALELPKWEVKQEVRKQKESNQFSQEEYEKQLAQQLQESKEKVWTPMLDNALSNFSSVSHQTKYSDNGNEVVLDVKYSLTEAEKVKIREELIDYVAQPSDSIYVNADGSVDMQRFVEDRTKQKYFDRLIQTAAKEAAATARKEFVKNELLNFDDSGRQRGAGIETNEIDYKDLFSAMKAKSNSL